MPRRQQHVAVCHPSAGHPPPPSLLRALAQSGWSIVPPECPHIAVIAIGHPGGARTERDVCPAEVMAWQARTFAPRPWLVTPDVAQRGAIAGPVIVLADEKPLPALLDALGSLWHTASALEAQHERDTAVAFATGLIAARWGTSRVNALRRLRAQARRRRQRLADTADAVASAHMEWHVTPPARARRRR